MKFVVSGSKWMGSGIGSIRTEVSNLLEQSKIEVMVFTYSITLGAENFFSGIEDCLKRDVTVRMVVNNFYEQHSSVINKIMTWKNKYPEFSLYDFVGTADLHSKLLIIDREKALVGSNNLSKNGELLNYELAVLIDDPNEVNIIAQATDKILRTDLVQRIIPS